MDSNVNVWVSGCDDKVVRVSKWNYDLNYDSFKYPGVEFVNGLDMGDMSKGIYVLFSIDLEPAVLTMNVWMDTFDEGLIQHSAEWELAGDVDEKESEIMHTLLLNLAPVICRNGFTRLKNDEFLAKIHQIIYLVDVQVNSENYKAVLNLGQGTPRHSNV